MSARKFSVMRCNHCDDASVHEDLPHRRCSRRARDNGVVDFDDDNCIGCKACMNACPYDAIYINPETNTAHKCNFCNHRVEVGLEPSCVVVCPTQAIKCGDLDDPTSRSAGSSPVTTSPCGPRSRTPSPRSTTAAPTRPRSTRPAPPSPNDGMIWADTTPAIRRSDGARVDGGGVVAAPPTPPRTR
jgi:Fe-S-cluster-containing dehydrogenase component